MPHLLPPFTRALLRRPARNFAAGITASAHLGAPDYALALRQHEAYCAALRDCGLELTILPADERFPDGHFVEDPVVIYRGLAFICPSGAEQRRGERQALLPWISDLRVLQAPPDARMDGGDALFCADRVLVGISRRTNMAGFQAFRDALQSERPGIRVDPVPFDGVLHLKSGLTELAPGLLLRDPALKTDYDLGWATVLSLPGEERHAADCMPVNGRLFIAAGCPTALRLARQYHDDVVELDLGEFVKMDGGLTCLSLRY